MLAVVAVAATVVIGLAQLAAGAVDAARARSAADATALAVAASGRDTGLAVAAANAAHVVSLTAVGDDVVVTVRVGRATATARARTYLADP